MFENILLEKKDGIAFLTVNRPKVLNALNTDTLGEISAAIQEIRMDDAVQVAIITGAGERAFVAGADISQMYRLTALDGRGMTLIGQAVMNEIEALEKPVIAAVNGFALGGGCELAMACDIRIASAKAKFGQPEVNLGIIPGYGGTQRLPRLIGKGNAKYYAMTAEQITADEAYRLGLVQKVVEHEKLMDEAVRVAKLIMAKAPVAVRMAKLAIDHGMDADVKTGVSYEAEAYTTCFATQDRIEGMGAFLEKREAHFQKQ